MLSAIIVDDEPKSLKNLKILAEEFVPGIQIVALCQTVDDALEAISQEKPDIVFLDIQMNNETGFDLLSKIKNITFEIIFVTAYSEFAIKAFKFSAIDYLLKPIDIDELKNAVRKVEEKKLGQIAGRLKILQENLVNPGSDNSKIALPSPDGLAFIKLNDIFYCQASSNYTKFHTGDNKQYMVCKTLKEYEELLLSHNFFRIHHSYLVNLNAIKKYVKGDGGYVILNNNVTLGVSKRKRGNFLERLSQKSA
jgi:two-component system, LytTR family, response regulator